MSNKIPPYSNRNISLRLSFSHSFVTKDPMTLSSRHFYLATMATLVVTYHFVYCVYLQIVSVFFFGIYICVCVCVRVSACAFIPLPCLCCLELSLHNTQINVHFLSYRPRPTIFFIPNNYCRRSSHANRRMNDVEMAMKTKKKRKQFIVLTFSFWRKSAPQSAHMSLMTVV